MKNQKKLLILNGSLSEITIIQAAKKLGYYVITSGNNPSLVGHSYADEFIAEDYSNKEAILELVKANDIDRIVSCANDFGVITSSYVAEKMGWPGHDTYENALVLHQKDLFKAFIQNLGIRCPESIAFDDKQAAYEYARTAEYPIIVKATDLTGGKGISRADDFEGAKAAIDYAFDRSRKKTVVIEPFVVGVQQSIVTFVSGGRVIASVSNDTYSPINPYLIQSETFPAVGIELVEDELHQIIEKICAKLSLVDGMFTVQYIVKDGKPYVIEMMRRCLGNQYLTVASTISGFPWEEALVRAETGMELTSLVRTSPSARFAGHHGIMAQKNGIVDGYAIDSSFKEHIFKVIEVLPKDGVISDYMNERIAYIYYAFDNQQKMINQVSKINQLIDVHYRE